MKLISICTIVLGLATSPLSSARAQDLELAVRLLTDTHHPAAGVPVRVEDPGGGAVVKATGISGQTRFDPVVAPNVVVVHAAPTVHEHGETLGGTYVLDVAPAHPLGTNMVFSLTQPLAQPILVSGDREITAEDYLHGTHFPLLVRHPKFNGGMFGVGTSPEAPYVFTVDVAHLPGPAAIQSYFAFRGADLDLEGYRYGLVLRQRNGVRMGYEFPLDLEIASHSHVFAGDVRADLLFVPAKSTADAPETYALTTAADASSGFVHVNLFGDLGVGDTVVLLKDGSQSLPQRAILVTPVYPDMALPEESGGGGGSVGALAPTSDADPIGALAVTHAASSSCEDCRPATPTPVTPWQCDDPGPPSLGFFHWLTAPCDWEASGLTGCQTATLPLGKVRCLSPNETYAREKRVTQKHEFSFAIKVQNPTQTGGGTGSYTHTRETTEAEVGGFQCDEGEHGCGRCYQWFEQVLVCVYEWNSPKHLSYNLYEDVAWNDDGVARYGRKYVGYVYEPCAYPVLYHTACEDQYWSSNACSRPQ